jgi:glutamate/tyrosine decarboxylase-like PLP-dependent enzyme
MASDNSTTEIKMDPANLFREDIFTDRRAGTLRVLTPVTRDGSVDDSRPIADVGEAQLMTPMGAIPLAFQIDAASLGEAAEKFSAGAKVAVERAVRELQELRREQASSIVIPEGMPPGLAGGMGGGMGGGKIKLP